VQVLYFLAATTPVAASVKGRALTHGRLAWLDNLQKQTGRIVREERPDSGQLAEQGGALAYATCSLACFSTPPHSRAWLGKFLCYASGSARHEALFLRAGGLAAGEWASASEMLLFIERVTEEAMLQWATAQNRTSARAVLDATTLNLLFGNFPPVRVSCLSSCTEPCYLGDCL
jgi:hypothetical protein